MRFIHQTLPAPTLNSTGRLSHRLLAQGVHRANGASARTIRYARAVLRAALNQALRWELVSRNVAALTDPPCYRAREIQPLSPDQAKILLAAVAGHRL